MPESAHRPYGLGIRVPPDAHGWRRIWFHVLVGLAYAGLGHGLFPIAYVNTTPEEGDRRP